MTDMKKNLLLAYFFLACTTGVFAQSNRTGDTFKAIANFMIDWHKDFTLIKYPVGSKTTKKTLGSGILYGRSKDYYSSSARFEGETESGFAIDDVGKAVYSARLGQYSSKDIDDAGKQFADKILNSIKKSDWDVRTIQGTYLEMSMNKIDIQVSLQRVKDAKSGQYQLILSIIRFTPVK
jgi:hypothetical protein